jgi:hypothetical protein
MTYSILLDILCYIRHYWIMMMPFILFLFFLFNDTYVVEYKMQRKGLFHSNLRRKVKRMTLEPKWVRSQRVRQKHQNKPPDALPVCISYLHVSNYVSLDLSRVARFLCFSLTTHLLKFLFRTTQRPPHNAATTCTQESRSATGTTCSVYRKCREAYRKKRPFRYKSRFNR